MNWVDLIILLIIGLFIWDGLHRGFLSLAWELVGLVLAFVIALRFYPPVSEWLISLHLGAIYSKPIAFLILWVLTQAIFYLIGIILTFYTPAPWKDSKINRHFGTVPGFFKGIIFVAVVLVFLIIMPISNRSKNIINQSYFSGVLIKETAKIENQMEIVFGGGNNFLTLSNLSTSDADSLNFTTTDFTINESGEDKMLSIVNQERAKVGLSPLSTNKLLRNVARAHSRDMLLRGYFAHNSPDGETLFDRLTLAHVSFKEAAENIALAPTIELAQIGLMNSPKHKINILDPEFTTVGIGVIDAGPYGLMVTQDFIK